MGAKLMVKIILEVHPGRTAPRDGRQMIQWWDHMRKRPVVGWRSKHGPNKDRAWTIRSHKGDVPITVVPSSNPVAWAEWPPNLTSSQLEEINAGGVVGSEGTAGPHGAAE